MEKYTLIKGNNYLEFYPERGGIITSLKFRGKEILYQDMLEETFHDTSQNVRGGIPIMFPQAGPSNWIDVLKLKYSLPQHGIVRQGEFELTQKTDDSAIIKFVSDGTNPKFPYVFRLFVHYYLGDTGLKISCDIKNNDTKEFPIAPGFHPYFAVNSKEDLQFGDFNTTIKNNYKVWSQDGTLKLPDTQKIGFYEGFNKTIYIESFGKLNDFWVWSMKDKDFICIEPVYGDYHSLRKNPYIIEPGEFSEFGMEIYYQKVAK